MVNVPNLNVDQKDVVMVDTVLSPEQRENMDIAVEKFTDVLSA